MQKTRQEIDAMTPDQYRAYMNQQDILVHGDDAPKGPDGRRIEQGIGSALHPTRNHVEALRNAIRAGYVKDPDGKIMAREEKRLADYEARKRGESSSAINNEGERMLALGHRSVDPPRMTPKHRGNPAGLIKARAAAKAKRDAAAAQASA